LAAAGQDVPALIDRALAGNETNEDAQRRKLELVG
jgi:hypothetical protein